MTPGLPLLLDEHVDEHVPRLFQAEIDRSHSEVLVWLVGDPGAPARSSSDPQVLEWCEANGFLLVTNNRSSMPGHLADHLARGRHVPGVVMLHQSMGVGETIENLVYLSLAFDPDELRDLIVYLPVV
jgi:hypothetical protein